MIKAIDSFIAWQYRKAGWLGPLPLCAPTLEAWLFPPPPQGLIAGSPGPETFKIKSGRMLPCVCWLLKSPSLQGPQTETKSEPLAHGCAQQQRYLWLDTGALDLFVPSLSVLRGLLMAWPSWPQMVNIIFSRWKYLCYGFVFSYGKIYAHWK